MKNKINNIIIHLRHTTIVLGFLYVFLAVTVFSWKLINTVGQIKVQLVEAISAPLVGQTPVLSPLVDTVKIVNAQEPPTTQDIISEITRVFMPEGNETVVWAIRCFYSESKFDEKAYNYNRNGSTDAGIAQINSIHGLSDEVRLNYKSNIQEALKIYKLQGREGWYGSDCD